MHLSQRPGSHSVRLEAYLRERFDGNARWADAIKVYRGKLEPVLSTYPHLSCMAICNSLVLPTSVLNRPQLELLDERARTLMEGRTIAFSDVTTVYVSTKLGSVF